MLFPGNLFDDFSVGIVLEQHFVLLRFIRLKKARISHLEEASTFGSADTAERKNSLCGTGSAVC